MVHSEQVNAIQHDIWDLHTSDGRWWVITNPTNLYSQEQFPNMDLALTFHIGLSIRIPRGEQSDIDSLVVEPLLVPWRALDDASEAIRQINEVEDCQTIGVRCREILLTMVHEAQRVLPAEESSEPPKNLISTPGHSASQIRYIQVQVTVSGGGYLRRPRAARGILPTG